MKRSLNCLAAALLGAALAAPAAFAQTRSNANPPPGMTPGASPGESGPVTLERPSSANTRDQATSSGAMAKGSERATGSRRAATAKDSTRAERRAARKERAAERTSRREDNPPVVERSSTGASGCDKLSGRNRDDCNAQLRSGDYARATGR